MYTVSFLFGVEISDINVVSSASQPAIFTGRTHIIGRVRSGHNNLYQFHPWLRPRLSDISQSQVFDAELHSVPRLEEWHRLANCSKLFKADPLIHICLHNIKL